MLVKILRASPNFHERVRSLSEVGVAEAETLWLRGGFPLSYLADSAQWREFYIRTFLERDIPALGIQIAPMALRRFWNMLVHYHAQVFNASDVGRSLNVADTTVRRYLDTLAGTLMVRRLQPWFENIGKRQVKAPKINRENARSDFRIGLGRGTTGRLFGFRYRRREEAPHVKLTGRELALGPCGASGSACPHLHPTHPPTQPIAPPRPPPVSPNTSACRADGALAAAGSTTPRSFPRQEERTQDSGIRRPPGLARWGLSLKIQTQARLLFVPKQNRNSV